MENALSIKTLNVVFSNKIILDQLNLQVQQKEILAIVGGSGSGKTTLLRSILLLLPASGSIMLFGREILSADEAAKEWARTQWGMMFQQGALFSSLTVLENIMFPLKFASDLNINQIEELARLKITLVGLEESAAELYPAELSGGMKKRAAIARALALDPQILFLDEPTAGLDPHGASALDELVLNLKSSLGLTIVMVTHDLDTLWRTTDRLAFLGKGKIRACLPINDMIEVEDPLIFNYFNDVRARVATQKYR